MYIVEIHRDGAGLTEPMTQFRTWLDSRHISVFRFSMIREGTIFRLEFSVLSEAEAFARAFGGQVIRSEGTGSVAA